MARSATPYWIAALIVLALAAAGAWLLGPTPPSGPWRAQIVDAETGQPLHGVIVLAIWDKISIGWPHPDRQFYDLDEVVSDAEGRFVIPARVTGGRHPFERLARPMVRMFKPGYGDWRFQRRPDPADTAGNANWDAFAQEGVVIVMPRAKTRDERLQALSGLLPGPDVPMEKFPRMLAAYDRERVNLGLGSR
jgi:hypothetical protein